MRPDATTSPSVRPGPAATGAVDDPQAACDLSTQCGHCGGPMRPEHAHYRCTMCGQRDSCCDGPY